MHQPTPASKNLGKLKTRIDKGSCVSLRIVSNRDDLCIFNHSYAPFASKTRHWGAALYWHLVSNQCLHPAPQAWQPCEASAGQRPPFCDRTLGSSEISRDLSCQNSRSTKRWKKDEKGINSGSKNFKTMFMRKNNQNMHELSAWCH